VVASRLLLIAACLALTSCFLVPHKIEILQGNYLDAATLARLKPGMTRSQVRFLLGTPLVTDAFHPDRWDYLFLDRKQGKLVAERRLTLWFEGDKLHRAITNAPVQPLPPAPSAQASPSAQAAAPVQALPPAQAQQSAAQGR
jgi:outer membrane protein assembly factor BamE